MSSEQAERAGRTRADLLTACALAALGLATVYLSWTMPRLEARHVHPATIPGLVPLILGAALTLCAIILAVRALRVDAAGGWRVLWSAVTGPQARRAGIALALVLLYALVLVGRLPFWLASGIFIFAFIMVFEMVLARPEGTAPGRILWALAIAAVAGGGIHYVFQYVFLVRLP